MNQTIRKPVLRLVSMLLVMALLAGQTVTLAAPAKGHFTDVPENSWAYPYVEQAYTDGAVNGMGGNAAAGTGIFAPDKSLTYGEFVAILMRAFYAKQIPAAQAGEPWYAPSLKTGVTNKLLTVDTLDQAMARAQEPINRYDMAEILVKILINKKVSLPSLDHLSAVNTKIGDWDQISQRKTQAYYVSCAYALDLLSGVDEKGTFMGDATVSRAVAAVVYCRMAETVEPDVKKEPNTNTETPAPVVKNVEDLKKIPGIEKRCNVEGLFQLRDNWYYSTASGQKDAYIEGIFASLYPQYAEIFGDQAMSYRPVILYNVPEAPSPITSPYEGYTLIKLSLDKTSYWSQMIYQLSHEMTHYAFFSLTPNATIEKGDWNDLFSEWNEEILCETMSLYMLHFMAEHWADCPLAKVNPTYGPSIEQYRKNAYEKYKDKELLNGSSSLSRKDFQALSAAADEDRSQHGAERNYCYDLFVKYGNQVIGEVLQMYRYYNPTYSDIDFAAWADKSQHKDFVKELSRIQPEITTD